MSKSKSMFDTNITTDYPLKDTKKADYTVIQAWAKVGPNHYLIDQVRARMGFSDQVIATKTMRMKWANVPMSKSMFDTNITTDYPLEFNTSAQIEAYAQAYADRVAFENGTAPDMHIREPLRGNPTVRPRPKAALPPVSLPKPAKLPKPAGLPPVPAFLDLGGKWSPF